EARWLIRLEAVGQAAIRAVAKHALHAGEIGREALVRLVGEEDGKEALAPGRHVVQGEAALALAGASLAEGEKPAQAGGGRPARRERARSARPPPSRPGSSRARGTSRRRRSTTRHGCARGRRPWRRRGACRAR